MTTTVRVHVNGNYRATVKQPDQDPVFVGPNEEKTLYIRHPVDTTIAITEEYLGEKAPAA